MQARIFSTSQDLYVDDAARLHDKNGFTLVFGDAIQNGAMVTRTAAQKAISQALKERSNNDWLIIDEASDFLTEDIFEAYLSAQGPRLVLSDQSLIRYSASQRVRLLRAAKQIVLYKTRHLDGNFIEQVIGSPQAKQIAVMKQYHYYWIDGHEQTYTKSPWPIGVI